MKAEIRPTNILVTPEAKGVWLATGDAAIFVPYNELLMLGCMLHGAFLDHIRGTFEVAREERTREHVVSDMASQLAGMVLQEAIDAGKQITIPSLGIVLNKGRKDQCPRCDAPLDNLTGVYVMSDGDTTQTVCGDCKVVLVKNGWRVVAQQRLG